MVLEAERKKRSILLGLLGFCFLIRLTAFWGSKNFAYDAVTRTGIAEIWSADPFLIASPQKNIPPQYGPLPIYLYGMGLKLVNNRQLVPRLISLFFATLTLIPFYFLMEILYGYRRAQAASLFFCLYTLLIKSAVVASSESIFCFFLLMAVWRFYAYKSAGGKNDLLWGIIFMNMAGMSRFNGWLYIPLLTFFIPENWRKISRGEMLLMLWFSLGSLLFPFLWLVLNWRIYGDIFYPIRFILMDHMRVIAKSGLIWSSWSNKLYLLSFWPGVLMLSLTPPIAFWAVMGLGRVKNIRWGKHLLILAVVPTGFIFFRVLTMGTFFPMARFVIDSGIFLLGYAALGYERFLDIFPWEKKRWASVAMGGVVFLSVFLLLGIGLSDIPVISSKIRSVSPLVRLEPTQEKVISFLKGHMQERVVLDSYRDWSEVEIMFYSGFSRANFFTRWDRWDRLIAWIRKMHPRFLVTGPGGRAWDLVQNEKLWLEVGYKPILLLKAGRQNVYRLEPV